MDYKKKTNSEQMLAVCEKCGGIVEPKVKWNDGWFDIFEWQHAHPLSFLSLYRKEGEKRRYEIECNGSDELRALLRSVGEQWTMYARLEDIRAHLRWGLYEIFNSQRLR